MLRRLSKFVAAILAAAVMAAPPLAVAQDGQRRAHKRIERTQIEALEQQWRQVVLAGDTPGMDKLLSEDFIGIEANGEVVTKAQLLDHIRNRQFVITQLETSEVKIKLTGEIATVTSLAQVTGVVDGEHLQGAYRYTRIYQHLSSGAWKVTNFQVTRVRRAPSDQAKN